MTTGANSIRAPEKAYSSRDNCDMLSAGGHPEPATRFLPRLEPLSLGGYLKRFAPQEAVILLRAKPTPGGAFLANIYRIWQLRYVDVPNEVVVEIAKEFKAGAKRVKYIPVIARVNGRSVRTTLLPAGGGKYRMQFNAELRKAARADTGELVSVELSPDRQSREIPVPADLSAALRQHPTARKAFGNAPPGYRRQILKWMAAAKSDQARARRIAVVMDRMLERAMLRPDRRAIRKNR